MSWREDAIFGKLRAAQLFLGRAGQWQRIDKRLRSLFDADFMYEDFQNYVVGQLHDGGAAAGTTGAENDLIIGGQFFQQHILGAGQTIILPVRVTAGLDIGLDQTADEGMELTNGIDADGAKRVFTVGTDPAFYFKVKMSIEDVSGTDDCAIGFRKLEAFQANVDDYDEAAFLNVIAGDLYTETILNNAATDSTDTTEDIGDAETHTYEVRVSAAGVVTFYLDGTLLTGAGAYTFDDAEVVIPFVYHLNHTGGSGVVALQEWEWGLL